MKIGAFIIDFNTEKQAQALSVMLRRTSSFPSHFKLDIFHVDNASPVPARLSAEQEELGITLIRNSKNDGYAGGFEEAIEAAKPNVYDYYLLLNSDLELREDLVGKLVSRIESSPGLAIVGARILSKGSSKKLKIWGARGVIHPNIGLTRMIDWRSTRALPKWSYIPGAVMLIRRTALEAVGGFERRYRMYFEETDLCVRLQRCGWDLAVVEDAIVFHALNSSDDGIPSRSFSYFFIRNNLAFWEWNFGRKRILQAPILVYVLAKEVIVPTLFRIRSCKKALVALRFSLNGFLDAFKFTGNQTTFEAKKFPK